MDCNDVQRYAGDAIDKSLPKELEYEFQAHLNRCKACSREVALEKLSKYMVRQNVKRISTPQDIQSLVLSSLHREYEHEKIPHSSWLTKLFPTRAVVPALAGVMVALVFFFLVSTRLEPSFQSTAHTAANDIINQSFKSFALLQAGKLQPDMVSTVPESVSDFFDKSNLRFDVHMPNLGDCDWFGGAASECSGVKQAHVVYKMGSEWVYVLEVSDDDALYGTQVSLPLAAKRALAQSGWYTDPDHPNCNVVLWKTDEAVCVAVSTMKKGRLLALLTTQ